MAEYQAMSANAGVVSDHNRTSRIDKGHLHDLTIASDHEPGIRELEAANKYLFINLTPLPDVDVWGVQEGGRSNLDIGSQSDVLASHDSQKSDRCVIAHFDSISADDGPKPDGDPLADPVTPKSIDPRFDKPGPQPKQKDLSNWDT